MSPDNYKSHPFVQRMIQTTEGLTQALPNIARYIVHNQSDFRGITAFQGDTADIVIALKVWGPAGEPLICWSSGDDPLLALINLDKKVGSHEWREDKKAEMKYEAPSPASSS